MTWEIFGQMISTILFLAGISIPILVFYMTTKHWKKFVNQQANRLSGRDGHLLE